MQATQSVSKKEQRFTARFGGLFSFPQNPDFKGAGEIIIEPSSREIVFKANRRAFLSNRPTEISFGYADIDNVRVRRDRIQFETRKGRSGRKRLPFVFWLDDATRVDAVASALRGNALPTFAIAEEAENALRLNAAKAYPPATAFLVLANLATFIYLAAILHVGWFATTDMTPYMMVGANNGALTTQGEWWRLITSMFMHYGLTHALLNCWALWSIGSVVERWVKPPLFLIAYFSTGVFAGLTSIFAHGDKAWSAGASGAIFGIYGVFIGLICRDGKKNTFGKTRPALTSMVAFVGYNIVYALNEPTVDLAGHLGGLASGLALGLLMTSRADHTHGSGLEKKSFYRIGLGAAIMIGIGVVALPSFDHTVKDDLLFKNTVQSYISREHGYRDKFHHALSLAASGKENSAELVTVADDVKAFYGQWSQAITALTLTSPSILEQRKTTLAAIDKQLALIDSKLAERIEVTTVTRLSEEFDHKIKIFAEESRNGAELRSLARRMDTFLNEIKSRINNVETVSAEAIPMKANLLSRVESRQGTLTEITAQIDYFDRLAALETEMNQVVQEHAGMLRHSEADLSTDGFSTIISTMEQKLIPRLRNLRARMDQNAPRSEDAAKAWGTLVNELETKLAASQVMLSSFKERAASSRASATNDRLERNHKSVSN